MNEVLKIVLVVSGGLGAFLLGMKHLSEGLQAVSGSGLRKFMSLATTHRLAGVLTGCISTIIVQSSSIITVMAVGFVSSGLLDLTQAINVIIGSNIGTTATAWLIAVVPDVCILGLGIVVIGMIFYFFCSGETIHNVGLAFLGLGLIFMGLFWMNQGVAPIKTHPASRELFASLDAATVPGLLKCFVVSLVFTAVVQSSAATTAIAMTLATQGIITFETAAATVFGMNIGTTATAWLAALGSSTEAKRTALAHTLFNLGGTVIIMPIFIPVVLPLTKSVFPNWMHSPAAPMAAIHTAFNIFTTVLFLPFVRQFAALVIKLTPVKSKQDDGVRPRLVFLNEHVRLSPQIACSQAFGEVCYMAKVNSDMLNVVRDVVSGTADAKAAEKVAESEESLDGIQNDIVEFLGRIMITRTNAVTAEQSRALLKISDELESISDEWRAIVKAVERAKDDSFGGENDATAVILDIHDRVSAFSDAVGASLFRGNDEMGRHPVKDAEYSWSDINERIRSARRNTLLSAGSGEGSALRALARLDILNAYERVSELYLNISDVLSSKK